MAIKVILTGVTGMVGEGVLLECLQNSKVDSVLAVTRRPLDVTHPKLEVWTVPDFLAINSRAKQLREYDGCFYCAGISSNGVDEATYTKMTYDTTLHFAKVMLQVNPKIVFNFVSGYQTDSTENGNVMWARIKGKTENALMKMFPDREYNFRPALMKPMPGQKQFYGYNRWMHKILYPVLSFIFPACSIQDITRAMIATVSDGFHKTILEVCDIKALAKLSE